MSHYYLDRRYKIRFLYIAHFQPISGHNVLQILFLERRFLSDLIKFKCIAMFETNKKWTSTLKSTNNPKEIRLLSYYIDSLSNMLL